MCFSCVVPCKDTVLYSGLKSFLWRHIFSWNFDLPTCNVDPAILDEFEQPDDFFDEIKRFGI